MYEWRNYKISPRRKIYVNAFLIYVEIEISLTKWLLNFGLMLLARWINNRYENK